MNFINSDSLRKPEHYILMDHNNFNRLFKRFGKHTKGF